MLRPEGTVRPSGVGRQWAIRVRPREYVRAWRRRRCAIRANGGAGQAAANRSCVRPNPAFFDATRPGDVQVITLGMREVVGGRRRAPYPTSVMEAALERFDWSALSALAR